MGQPPLVLPGNYGLDTATSVLSRVSQFGVILIKVWLHLKSSNYPCDVKKQQTVCSMKRVRATLTPALTAQKVSISMGNVPVIALAQP